MTHRICAVAALWLAVPPANGCGDPNPTREPDRSDAGSDVASDGGPNVTVVWVDPAASVGGDGSLGAPFASMADAVASGLGDNTTLRLAAGQHPLPSQIELPPGTRIEGAGIGLTVLVGAESSIESTGAVGIAGLSVAAAISIDAPARRIESSALAPASSLRLSGGDVELTAVQAEGASIELLDLTRLEAVGLDLDATALWIERSGDTTVLSLVSVRSAGPALTLVDSVAELRDVSISDAVDATDARGDGVVVSGGTVQLNAVTVLRVSGRGLNVGGDATVEADGLVVEGAGDAAVGVNGAQVDLVEAELRVAAFGVVGNDAEIGVVGGRIAEIGSHCILTTGGALTVGGAFIDGCGDGGISSIGHSALSVSGTSVTSCAGACVSASESAGPTAVSLTTVSDCIGSGLAVLNVDDLSLSGVEVHTVAVDPLFGTSEAVAAVDSSGTLSALNVHDVAGAGVSLLRSTFSITDSTLWRLGDAGVRAVGVGAATTTVRGCTIEQASAAGVFVSEGRATVDGNVITGTRLLASEGLGEGVVFGLGASVDVLDNTIEQSAGAGVTFFSGASGTVDGNRLTGNRGRGIQEYCIDEVASPVVVGGSNVFADNALGDVERCTP